MKYLYAAVVFFLLSAGVCRAQHVISGSVFDTMNYTPMRYASVMLVRTSDSVIETFTHANLDGTFNLKVANEGKYDVLITYPGFADYTDAVTVRGSDTVQLGTINLVSRSHLLNEVVITKQIAAIKINGDTTEFMADSFSLKDNATVEDLLKALPGLEVDKNGKIIAQGEAVKKILVDGEEFFSDDPSVVTKNFQAAVVERVQVYDKKSDQATFTGIDDGIRDKTINLQLKADKKKGFFGKIDVGGGTDDYHQETGMINNFKGKEQLSFFGIASNTDQVGLNGQDADKYGSTNEVTNISDGNDVINYFSTGNADFTVGDGSYTGEGLPQVATGGVHYADKWNEDKEHVSANYRYADQQLNENSNTTTQNLLPNNVENITQQSSIQTSRGERHGADGMYEWKMDSTATLKFTVSAQQKNSSSLSIYNTTINYDDPLNNVDSVINRTIRHVNGTAVNQNINSDLLYQKKFKKKGRTISIDVKENYKTAQSNGNVYANSVFAGGGDTVDQRKQNSSNTLAFLAKAVYTEPISKTTFLQVDYSASLNNSTTEKYSYDKAPGTESYSAFDSAYSSNYKFNVLTNTGGATMRFVYTKITFSVGGDISNARYDQTDLLNRDTTYRYNYLNFFPNANFTYHISKTSFLTVNYMGSTRQPTIDQVAPLKQNTDPLNVEVGNPGIKQQFENNLFAMFNQYHVVSGSYVSVYGNFSFIKDAISTAQTTDPATGIRDYQFINVSGNYTGSAGFNYNFKIKQLGIDMGPDANIMLAHTEGYINGLKNISNDNAYTLAYTVRYNKDSKFHLREHPSFTYSVNQASIATGNPSNYWQFYNDVEVNFNLPLKFEIGSEAEWWLRPPVSVFTGNTSIFKWNAYLLKKLLPSGKLQIKAAIYDILNQNTGLNRSAQNNIITQQQNNTIRRHGMLSVIWDFSRTPHAPVVPTDSK